MRHAWPVPALLALAACGGGDPGPPAVETAEYRAWKGKQISIPAAGFAPEVRGSIEVIPSEGRVTHPDAFCEIYLNGNPLHRFRVAKLPDGTWPTCVVDPVMLRTGPDWIDLWDSSTNRNYRHQVDTRQGTVFVFTPTGDGYGLEQSARE